MAGLEAGELRARELNQSSDFQLDSCHADNLASPGRPTG